MYRWVSAAVACTVAWQAIPARGAPAAPLKLSIDEAERRALDGSPLVRRAREERAVTGALRAGAAVAPLANPAVSATVGHRRDSSGSAPPAQGVEWGLRLEQGFEIGGQRGTRLKEAARALDTAEARLRLAQIETRARVRSAYVGVLLSRALQESARRREALAVQVLDAARKRVGAGAASDVEVRLAEVERGRLGHERMEAELAAVAASSEVRLLLGLPVDTALELTSPLATPRRDARALADLVAAAQARRQEVTVLAATHATLDAQLVRLRREVVPSPTLFFDVQAQQPGQLYLGGGLGIALPVFRRNQGELARARAEIDRLRTEGDLLAQEIAIEVERGLAAVRTRSDESTLWTETILPAAEAGAELVRQGWLAGKFDIFRLIQATRDAADAQRRQLEVLGDLWQASIDLARATGDLP